MRGRRWRACLVIDARTAFDALESEGLPGDRRVALDMAALREDLKRDGLHSLVRWVPGPQQLADGLTKRFGNAVLEATMSGEGWSLREQEGCGSGGSTSAASARRGQPRRGRLPVGLELKREP